ncbi:MAG: 3-isopropylmalate dehydratase small subunit [Gemmatimonadetes bacterium]|nr:3-isopropylmalate dehydratase small subunit [Gemmatimonadota bacterium]
MEPIRRFRARLAVLPVDNIDTDQIIPARFLKGTTREGLGRSLFADWRRDADGRPRPDFPLNRPDAQGAGILVVGTNFGCGSSREHAVWALLDHGVRAVIAGSFGDIFRTNALKNGLLPIVLAAEVHERLRAAPGSEVTVDLEAREVRSADGTAAPFAVDHFARYRLLHGVDELDFLLSQESAIEAYERQRKGASL